MLGERDGDKLGDREGLRLTLGETEGERLGLREGLKLPSAV